MTCSWTSKALALVGAGLFCAACSQQDAPLAPDGDLPGLASAAAVHQPFGRWAWAVSVDPGGGNHINTDALEGCPSESTDGRFLFFASNRPGGHGGIDIWVARRSSPAEPWGDPQNLPAPVNSAANDFCPTPLPGGELLFVSNRAGGCGDGTADIYRTRLHPGGGWLAPEHLGCDVNSHGNEFSPSYVPAGGGMLFFSSDRDLGPGLDRIFVSLRRPGGGWGPAVEVAELNMPGFSTARPNVSQNGRELVFDSNRPGGLGGPDIWAATRPTPLSRWSEPFNLGSNVNSAAGETRPSLSRDGRRLYFGSNRDGGEGNFDIYVATRAR